jgi:capsular polysaccharide biosynthesis protein
MATQPSTLPDDDTDIHDYVRVLIHAKWAIAGFVLLAVAAMAVVSYALLPERYQATTRMELPTELLMANETAGLGFSLETLERIATSGEVRDRLAAVGLSGASLSAGASSELFDLTVSSASAQHAVDVATAWSGFFRDELSRLVVNQRDQRLRFEMVVMGERIVALEAAEDALAAFDLGTDIFLLESELAQLKWELVGNIIGNIGWKESAVVPPERGSLEQRLRQLVSIGIPLDQERERFLRIALGEEAEFLNAPAISLGVPELGRSGVITNEVILFNPVYLELSTDLVQTTVRLASNRREAELLREQIKVVRSQIDKMNQLLIPARIERGLHAQLVTTTKSQFDHADSVLAEFRQVSSVIVDAADIDVLFPPELPAAAISPQPLKNTLVAAVAALLLAMIAAYIVNWYRRSSGLGANVP